MASRSTPYSQPSAQRAPIPPTTVIVVNEQPPKKRYYEHFGLSGPLEFIKYLVFFGNLLIFLFGGVLIGVGIYAQTSGTLFGIVNITIPIGIIVLGAAVAVISFFGCCGAARESRILLGLFVFVLLILMACQIGVGIGAYVWRGHIPNEIQVAWGKVDNKTRTSFQEEFTCCGFFNTSDLPALPCPTNATLGCEPKLKTEIQNKLDIVFWSALVIGLLQVISLLLSSILICALPSEDEQRKVLLDEARSVNRNYNQ